MADTKRRTKGSQADLDQGQSGYRAPIKKKLEKEKSQYGSYGTGESSGTFRRYVEEGAYKKSGAKRGEGRPEGEERPRRSPSAAGRPNDRWSEDRPRRAPSAAGRPNDRWSEDRPKRAPSAAGRPNDRWSEDRPRRAPEGAGRPNDRWSEDRPRRAPSAAGRPRRVGTPTHEGPNRWSQDRNSGNRNFRDDDRNSRGRSVSGRPTSAPFGDRNRSTPRSFSRPAENTGLSLSPRMIAAMKAAVGREIPEAMKQLNEAKNCIFQAVTALMTINEKLIEQNAGKSDILNKLSAEYTLLADALCEIQDVEKSQKDILLQAQEHFMFQDLAGQRLNKVSDVLDSLDDLLSGLSGMGKTPGQPAPKIPAKSKEDNLLLGPQAKGEGLDQENIDSILEIL